MAGSKNVNLLNGFALILICALTAAAPAFAEDESAKALKEYEEDVQKAYEPVSPAENYLYDAYLLNETKDVAVVHDAEPEKVTKPLKVEKKK